MVVIPILDIGPVEPTYGQCKGKLK